MLPTPQALDYKDRGDPARAARPWKYLRDHVLLLPTPETGQSPNGHGVRGGRPGNGHQSGATLRAVLLPTPVAEMGHRGGRGAAPRRAASRAAQGRTLTVTEAMVNEQPLLPTPQAADAWNHGDPALAAQAERDRGRWGTGVLPNHLQALTSQPRQPRRTGRRSASAGTGRRSAGGKPSPG